jgi:hypothetical protein
MGTLKVVFLREVRFALDRMYGFHARGPQHQAMKRGVSQFVAT